ncbi:MAG: hypothetical protein JO353_07270 [Phycisphaerae bacterium]|nr:hypothetical protein [Phycisphaerae bacterium]
MTIAGLLTLGGLGFAGGCSDMKPGNLAAVQPTTLSPRVGNVFLFRGIVGVFSTGLDRLGVEINNAGVRADVYQDDQWKDLAATLIDRFQRRPDAEPIIMVGHSWGADHIIMIAQRLNAVHIPVALILTLDPVTPPDVPSNVIRCENLYQTNGWVDIMPWFRGVELKAANSTITVVANYNLHDVELGKLHPELYAPDANHFSIEKEQKVHEEVIRQVLALCPPRAVWYAQRNAAHNATLVQYPATQPTAAEMPTTKPARTLAAASN